MFECFDLLSVSESAGKSKAYLLFCAGGSRENGTEPEGCNNENSTRDSNEQMENANGKTNGSVTEHAQNDGIQLPVMNKFLGTTFATFLMKRPVKIAVIAVYAVILSMAIYGVSELEEGIESKYFVPDDSYYQDYYDIFERDFTDFYGQMIMIGIDENVRLYTGIGAKRYQYTPTRFSKHQTPIQR